MGKNKRQKEDFAHLHVHSDMSQLDGCGKIGDYVKVAKKRGNDAIAFTEHGTMRGYLQLRAAAEQEDIKPIFGCEFYVSKDMHRKGVTDEEKAEITKGKKKPEHRAALKEYESAEGIRERWHTTVWAMNAEGMRNLQRLSSQAYTEGFYYKPRVDLNALCEHNEGLAVSTGCLSGPAHDMFLQGKKREAFRFVDRLHDSFGDRMFLEIQPHAIGDQARTNKFALALKDRTGARLVGTQDAHYVNEGDHHAHDLLLCIGTGAKLTDEDRFKFDGDEFYFRTRRQMRDAFRRHHGFLSGSHIKEALDTTVEIAERCSVDVEIDYLKALLPNPGMPKKYGVDDFRYMRDLCLDGWTWRGIPSRAREYASKHGVSTGKAMGLYVDRLKTELRSLKKQKFVSYFLVVRDLYSFARAEKIMCGPGRGSAGGSLVSYLLGITSVDPVEHGLLFERFINPDRCFPAGTLVRTECGWKPIESIQPFVDRVATRQGYMTVLDAPCRETTEDMVEIGLVIDGHAVSLTTTLNHVLYRSRNGKVEAKRAGDFKIGDGVVFDRGFLRELWPGVSENGLEQTDVLSCVRPRRDDDEEEVSREDVSTLQRAVHGREESEVLLEEVRATSELKVNSESGPIGLQRRPRVFCPIFPGGGLCKNVDFEGREVRVRAGGDSSCKRNHVYSRLFAAEYESVCRTEGLERAGQGQAQGRKAHSSESPSGPVLSPSDRTPGGGSSSVGHGVRTTFRFSVSSVQDIRKNLPGVQATIPGSRGEAAPIFPVQPGMCECGKVQSSQAREDRGQGKGASVVGGIASPRSGERRSSQEDLQDQNGTEAPEVQTVEISSIRRVPGSKAIRVYDLCVNVVHEYFANGILVKNSDLPDIDMDFEDARRGEVIEYLIGKYGRDKVCQIATVGKLSGKQCLRDVSRVLGVHLAEVNQISASIIDRPDGHPRQFNTIEDSFREFKDCKAFSDRHPAVLKNSKTLEGMAKTLGVHPAGVVVSPTTLTDLIPLEVRKSKGTDVVVSACDMNEIASVGLVKLDVLGLRTLTVVRDCLDSVKDRHDITIDMERIDMNDPKILQAFTDRDFSGVFQYDTQSAYNICRDVVFEDFEDIASMTALNRPGASHSGLDKKYLIRKKNPKKRGKVDFHPLIHEICSDTLGIIVYQEHVIKIFTVLAGFSPGKADTLRKAMGKKKAEVIKASRGEFVKGCKKLHGIREELASKIYSAIEAFGSYGFNKSHATEYAAIAYWCQFLKIYYPVEFYCALLKNEPDSDKVKAIAKAAKKRGIRLLNPDVQYSRDVFSIDPNGNVRGSLVDIKGVGDRAAQTVMECQPFTSFIDFANRIDRRACNRGVVVALLQAGALSSLVPNQRYFADNLESLWKALQRKRGRREAVTDFWKAAQSAPDYSTEERMLIAGKVNPLAFGEHPLEAYAGFMKQYVKVPITKIDGDDFWKRMDGKSVFIAGLITDVRTHQVGDFHTGDIPSKREQKQQFWGQRYSNVSIEGSGGRTFRVKFDVDIYESHRETIEGDTGTPVIIHATVDGKYDRLKAHFLINLEDYRKAVRSGEEIGPWGRLAAGDHPCADYPWKDAGAELRRRYNDRFLRSKKGGAFTGIVTHVRLKYDKQGREMAFFGLLGERGYVDVIAFSSVWEAARKAVRRGRLLSMPVDRVKDKERGIAFFFSGGRVRVLKKSAGWDFPA